MDRPVGMRTAHHIVGLHNDGCPGTVSSTKPNAVGFNLLKNHQIRDRANRSWSQRVSWDPVCEQCQSMRLPAMVGSEAVPIPHYK